MQGGVSASQPPSALHQHARRTGVSAWVVGLPHAPLCTISAPGMLRMCSVVGCLISGRRSGLTASAAHGPGGRAVRVWVATALRKATPMKRVQTYAIQNIMQRLASRLSQGPGGPRPGKARAVQARQPPRAIAPPVAGRRRPTSYSAARRRRRHTSDSAARRRAAQTHERPRRQSKSAAPRATVPPIAGRHRPASDRAARRRAAQARATAPPVTGRHRPASDRAARRRAA